MSKYFLCSFMSANIEATCTIHKIDKETKGLNKFNYIHSIYHCCITALTSTRSFRASLPDSCRRSSIKSRKIARSKNLRDLLFNIIKQVGSCIICICHNNFSTCHKNSQNVLNNLGKLERKDNLQLLIQIYKGHLKALEFV